ncbi:MAG TPA: hypothetical protein VJI70_00670 [Candidatus Paceibacterota bacterium]
MDTSFLKKEVKFQWKFRHSVYVLLGIFFLYIIGVISDAPAPAPVVQPTVTQSQVAEEAAVPQVQENPTAKADAQKELDRLMALSEKAGLVTSYEFSDSASVVYVGSVWYTQTVQFKKDFLAKIGTLKKQITGYMHFEIRDAYSNEKVAEVTAFSSSLKVYK